MTATKFVLYGRRRLRTNESTKLPIAKAITTQLATNIVFGLLLRNARIDKSHMNSNAEASMQSPMNVNKLSIRGLLVKSAGNPKQNIVIDIQRLAYAR